VSKLLIPRRARDERQMTQLIVRVSGCYDTED
jgi:hypothetical protein